ncbi:iron-sulfur cluster-binding protein [Planomonospora sphaerica]|uniref:Iron-sulfur cluster-binding protein n=1 Tax=Planomonospora sphaerica TaxID=161355 RepID=A0A161LNE0_9ACTN|nr:lactate utilization protein B [Planomonospora sphaerica]GAT70917.1 iron-sulfur cluster-binding protein [Planomonospora sphaerica]
MSATFLGMPAFPRNAARAVGDSQLRFNLRKATRTIRGRRAAMVGEVPGWEELRAAGRQIKDHTLRHLDRYLLQLEEAVTRAGGRVHWAADADEANRIVAGLVEATGETSVVKVKSMATQEIGLNEALAARGITAYETDLAELIVQLGDDLPSHILVPAIHRNRAEIREIFREKMAEWGRPAPEDLTDEPHALAEAARLHLRERFLSTKVAVSGANFMIAETGTLVVLESEGNGRMCLTLPETLISVVGIEKLLPTWQDLEVFLQLLPRSSTGERMNPYTSTWTGASEGQEFHLVLLDNGRTRVLADEVGRQALRCIRCSACLNVCPVYERVGGHAYGSVYPGPIGAILTPQLRGTGSGASAPPGGMPASATAVSRGRMPASATAELDASLPYASSLCGACYEVCPVAIDIPEVLVHLRAKAPHPRAERLAMRAAGWVLDRPVRLARVQRLSGRLRRFVPRRLPGPAAAWTDTRDIPDIPAESFRDWWDRTDGGTR